MVRRREGELKDMGYRWTRGVKLKRVFLFRMENDEDVEQGTGNREMEEFVQNLRESKWLTHPSVRLFISPDYLIE